MKVLRELPVKWIAGIGIALGGVVALGAIFLRRFFMLREDSPISEGRKPTEEEKKRMQERFPNLKDDFVVTDEPAPLYIGTEEGGRKPNPRAYNCLGYALCSKSFGWYEAPREVPDEKVLQWVEELYTGRGWKKAADCTPKKGVRKIAVYCRQHRLGFQVPLHAAKQIRDDWWESKVGQDIRIIHRGTASVESDYFGDVCRCYEKDLNVLLQDARDTLKAIQGRIASGENGFLKEAEKEAQEQVERYEKALAEEVGKE